jgi:hypothetical protein
MLPSLVSLDMSGAKPTPPDMGGGRRGAGPAQPMPPHTIQAMAELKNLRVLKLGYSGIAAGDLKALSVLQNVEKLGLEECPHVDDAAIGELVDWKSLKYLDLQDTKVTEEGVAALRKAKPGLVILTTPIEAKPTVEAKPKG